MDIQSLFERLAKAPPIPQDSDEPLMWIPLTSKTPCLSANIAWALSERKELAGRFFDEPSTRAIWFMSFHVARTVTKEVPVGTHATLISP